MTKQRFIGLCGLAICGLALFGIGGFIYIAGWQTWPALLSSGAGLGCTCVALIDLTKNRGNNPCA